MGSFAAQYHPIKLMLAPIRCEFDYGWNGVHARLLVNAVERLAPFLYIGQWIDGDALIIRTMKKEEGKSPCLFVHVGEVVAEVMYQKHISKADFAASIGTDRTNVYRILRKGSIETDQLYRYSKELRHNFFRDLAEEFERRFSELG